jgi:hypothetical protein
MEPMITTNLDMRQLMALSAQADHLAQQFMRNKITNAEYIGKLNELRQQYGLPPIPLESSRREAA